MNRTNQTDFGSFVRRNPEVKWAQRPDRVYLTVMLADAKDAKVNLEPEGKFTCTATAGSDNNAYEIKLDLFDKVNVEESKINVGVRSIFCVIEKAEVNWWKKLLRGDEKTPHYVKVDWDRWIDEDDDVPEGPSDDMGGMDFSKFGDMGGMMGGMGGMEDMMGGMGMDGDDDSEDDDELESKPVEEETKAGDGKVEAAQST